MCPIRTDSAPARDNDVRSGLTRTVHLLETQNDVLVKLLLTADQRPTPSALKKLIRKLFPTTKYRQFLYEIKQDHKVQILAAARGVLSPIAPTRGLVKTETGVGLLVQRIGPKEGGFGPTLGQLIADGEFDDIAMAALNDLAEALFNLKVIAHDINPENIVWGELDGSYRPLIVDGFGDRNVVSIRTWIPWLRHRSIHRGMERTAESIGLKWSREARQFS